MKLIKSKKAIVLLVLAIAAISAVGAYAYWTTSGNGTGSGTTGQDAASIVVHQTSSGQYLYPGLSVPLSGNFSNPETFNQYVTSVTASIDTFSLQADVGKPACTQADFFLTGSPSAVGQDITPGAANGTWSGISLHMTNAVTNQDNCKNITVPITYTSN